jgi:hypothetical protein
MKKHAYYEIGVRSCRVVSGKRVTRLLVVFVGSRSDYPIINRVVFGSGVTTRLIIGLCSCQTRLCNGVGRIDTDPTHEPELPTLPQSTGKRLNSVKMSICAGYKQAFLFFPPNGQLLYVLIFVLHPTQNPFPLMMVADQFSKMEHFIA